LGQRPAPPPAQLLTKNCPNYDAKEIDGNRTGIDGKNRNSIIFENDAVPSSNSAAAAADADDKNYVDLFSGGGVGFSFVSNLSIPAWPENQIITEYFEITGGFRGPN